MPGWYKVCQIGRSEQQVHLQQFVAFGVQGTLLASVFPVQFAVPAVWEAPVWVLFPSR